MSPEKAIVSPCSSCKNKRDQVSDGLPACPRLQWRTYAKTLEDAGQEVPDVLSPALLTGTEGTDLEGTDALRNPVYSDTDHHILVWVAALKDNAGIYTRAGELASPHILDPNFDTNAIQCRQLPYSVCDTEANYFMKGAYRENDLLQITEGDPDQLGLTAGDFTDFDPVRVAGTAEKIDFPYKFNRKQVPKDLSPRGT